MLDTHQAIGGSPQQPGLKWTHLRPCAVSAHLAQDDLAVSSYLVQQVYKHLHLGRRKMSKRLCMKQVAHRDEPFITHAWQGVTLLSVEQAQALAAQTTTQTGLEVAVWINRRKYPTGRQVNEGFKENLEQYIDFSENLPLWNYQIHPRLL